VSLQDKEKVTATIVKRLEFWCSGVEEGQLSYFPTLDNFLSERMAKWRTI